MKIFVTGHRGYIGSHLVELLKEHGHTITGCDLGLFDECAWEPGLPPDRELIKDTRQISRQDVEGHDCVMHLAALSNDPMGNIDAHLTYSINRDASVRLAKLAKEAGVSRYIFYGSCSVYGKGDKLDLEESDPLNPMTPYAASKIEAERLISELADADFTPTYMRNATAYGFSKMLRIDLVVNNLLASALAYNEIRIMSDGTPWRPLIHCRDIASASLALMGARREVIHDKAINIGADSENYQIKDIGDQVKQLIPSAAVVYTGEVGADPRNYRVRFNLLREILPDFRLEYNLVTGMEELHRKMVEHRFDVTDFESDQFVRLKALNKKMNLLMDN